MNFTLKYSWITLAGMASLASMLAVACTPEPPSPPAPPAAEATPKPPANKRVSAAPANAPTQQRPAPPVGGTSSEPQDVCKTTMAKVTDPDSQLNVRSIPEATGNIVGKLDKDTFVTVVAQKEGWFQISNPVAGWVSKSRTQSGCNQKTQRVSFPANANSVTITDRFIGTGSHKYLLNAKQGQTMTVKNLKDVFPTIVAPDGQILPGVPYMDGQKTEWTGKLPLGGDYTLLLESNFKGFEYEFSVKLN